MATRTRRDLRERAHRTYYAISADGKTLHRYQNHPARLDAFEADPTLKPLGALEYRNLMLEDVEGKLTVLEHNLRGRPRRLETGGPRRKPGRPRTEEKTVARRGPGRPRKAVVAPASTPVVQPSAPAQNIVFSKEMATELGLMVADALRPMLADVLATATKPAATSVGTGAEAGH